MEIHAYPMGPETRKWLGVPGKDYEGRTAPAPQAEDSRAFGKLLPQRWDEHPPASGGKAAELLGEWLQMGLPEPILAITTAYNEHRDFPEGLVAEGGAAMLKGEWNRAAECYQLLQETWPHEPAAYVNMAELLIAQSRPEEARHWLEEGLKVAGDHRRLWQLFPAAGASAAAVRALSEKHRSWLGASLASADLPPEERCEALAPYFHGGERSPDFLVEYTGLLGAAGKFDELSSLVWQLSNLDGPTLPWQVWVHNLQAQLAAGREEEAHRLAPKVLGRSDLPPEVRSEVEAWLKEPETPQH